MMMIKKSIIVAICAISALFGTNYMKLCNYITFVLVTQNPK